ncbi:MAG TPA: fasciclin domain-containing protein [Xanthomonadaceae bacterium]|nr:fasciclin domain-containing protein [Xanthomonadaceae bacterium]
MSTMTNTNTSPTRNLLDTAAANGSFTTFGKAVESAGMSDTLRGSGPFTVFAPTDAAFDKLPAGKLDYLLKPENKDELASLVGYHVLKGRKLMSEIGQWDTARTFNGLAAPVKLANDKVSIDGAVVTSADIGSSNGVIHGIDKVNIPAVPTKQ